MNELNKYINTRQFFKLYPEIPSSTFWRWTRTGVRIRNKNKWSKSIVLPLERMLDCGKGVSVRISLKALYKFFRSIKQEEYALRIPSYIKL